MQRWRALVGQHLLHAAALLGRHAHGHCGRRPELQHTAARNHVARDVPHGALHERVQPPRRHSVRGLLAGVADHRRHELLSLRRVPTQRVRPASGRGPFPQCPPPGDAPPRAHRGAAVQRLGARLQRKCHSEVQRRGAQHGQRLLHAKLVPDVHAPSRPPEQQPAERAELAAPGAAGARCLRGPGLQQPRGAVHGQLDPVLQLWSARSRLQLRRPVQPGLRWLGLPDVQRRHAPLGLRKLHRDPLRGVAPRGGYPGHGVAEVWLPPWSRPRHGLEPALHGRQPRRPVRGHHRPEVPRRRRRGGRHRLYTRRRLLAVRAGRASLGRRRERHPPPDLPRGGRLQLRGALRRRPPGLRREDLGRVRRE
mmetsp:Transcript_115362/g.359275  ORF Transcript_115362/g.359275 Transcript_115362/m.359275 type:complete len:365 (-) Transcript_115362:592-1686(-)